MSAKKNVPSVEEQIDKVKGFIADVVKRIAMVEDRRIQLWLQSLRAYREALAGITPLIRWRVRDALWSKVLVAEAPWAPQPSVTAPQLGLSYPLKTQHPVLGEIPYVQSLRYELARFDMRYLDIVSAIVEGSWKLIYNGEEYRPKTTAYFQQCTDPQLRGQAWFCTSDPLDSRHKCIKYWLGNECGVYSATVHIPDEGCNIDVFVFEGHYIYTLCTSDKCCTGPYTLNELKVPDDYDTMAEAEGARVVAHNSCSGTAMIVTTHGNLVIHANMLSGLLVTRARNMRDKCTYEF